jgi:hypothetical protein
VPLAALSSILFVIPRWRWAARWPALLLAVGALVVVQVAVLSGRNLQETRDLTLPLLKTHQDYASKLRLALIVLVVLVAVGFWALGHTTRLMGASDRAAKVAALEKPLLVVIPIVAVVVLVLVVLTGDAGARAVWQR